MMRSTVLAAVLVASYLTIIFPFSSFMCHRPFVVKLGYIPDSEILRGFSADQRYGVAAYLVSKVMFYFGSLVEKNAGKVEISPDYPAMSKTIHTAVHLDPYNMDAYYFAQAILVWDVGKVDIANELLDFGMKFRDWDFYLPFFAGFNNAYFLKNYEKAAAYYKLAAELSGSDLYSSLAGRYLYESGKTDLAIAYLTVMEKQARNDAIRRSFRVRLQALQEVRRIEKARDRSKVESGKPLLTVEELIKHNYLSPPPVDPYGGRFFIDRDGQVRSTSKFAFDTGRGNK